MIKKEGSISQIAVYVAFISSVICLGACSRAESDLAANNDAGSYVNPWTTDTGEGPGSDTTETDDNDTEPLVPCDDNTDCPPHKSQCAAVGYCVECLQNADCPGGICQDGACVSDGCSPGETMCVQNTMMTCNTAGDGWDGLSCSGGECLNGVCVGCTPGLMSCIAKKVVQCDAEGSGFETLFLCAATQFCIDGSCYDCYPGSTQCVNGIAQQCTIQGKWEDTENCGLLGLECAGGTCISDCVLDQKSSNQGCDYWAVDLDNHYDAQNGQYAIIISNLSDTKTATVTVTLKNGMAQASEMVDQKLVAPGGLEKFELEPRNMGDAGFFYTAYRVQSNTPIVAYQFNPLDNEEVFSNDASLLLPVNTYGMEYVAVSRFELAGGGPEIGFFDNCEAICSDIPGGYCTSANGIESCTVPYRGTISVVATQKDTTVQITPTANTLGGNGLVAMTAKVEYEHVLQPYQVLNIKSDQNAGDLTGTIIMSDKPVGVWSGHEAAIAQGNCCADHLEQQLFPTKTWGKKYVATKSFPRAEEKDHWIIVASEDDTAVGITPASVSPTKVLKRGAFAEIVTDQDFLIESTKPVQVAQLLASSYDIFGNKDPDGPCSTNSDCPSGYTCESGLGCMPPSCIEGANTCPSGHACSCIDDLFGLFCQCQPVGDPALILTPPVEQFRKDYVFLVPNAYEQDYVSIVAPNEATVYLDGSQFLDSGFTLIGDTGFKTVKLKVSDGAHAVTADQPVGVTVYGYDDDVSYGYTAGLNLLDL